PDISCRSNRVRLSVGPFRIHIDQAHLHGTERILKITVSAVAFFRQPSALRSPVQLFWFPHVGAPAAKTERLESHRIEGNVAGENHEIGPGDFPAILLLDGPEK